MKKSSEKLKQSLFRKLKQKNAFWSYDMSGIKMIPDEMLILKTFMELDIDDMNLLFQIYSPDYIKKVWREKLIPEQGPYKALNRMIAWFYFDIKQPDRYLKAMITKHYKNLDTWMD